MLYIQTYSFDGTHTHSWLWHEIYKTVLGLTKTSVVESSYQLTFSAMHVNAQYCPFMNFISFMSVGHFEHNSNLTLGLLSHCETRAF